MKKTVLIFGLLAGAVISALMALSVVLCTRGVIEFGDGEVIGYSSMFLAFLLTFFGIRSYRDSHGGTITFGRAFLVGFLITLVASACYVATWEVIYFKWTPDFAEKMTAAVIAEMRGKGASAADIEAKRQQLMGFKKIWDNPLLNAVVTLIEPLPVGLLATLVSSAILRKRHQPPAAAAATA